MSCPTVDQASEQSIGDSEFVNLVVRWQERDIRPKYDTQAKKNKKKTKKNKRTGTLE